MNYKLADTKNLVMGMLSYIDSNPLLAYDVESTGLNVRKDKIIGFAVSAEIGNGYYFPIFKWNKETQVLEEIYIEGTKALDMAPIILKHLIGKKLIMHNGSYDIQITKNDLGIDLLPYLYIDTIVLVHTLREEGLFALKEIAVSIQEEIGFDVESTANEEQIALKENVKANGGEVTKTNFELYKADLEVIWPYAVKDVDLTLRVCFYYLKKLEEEGLENFFFEEEVMPLLREVTIPMEQKGVRLDIPFIEGLDLEIQKDIKLYKERVEEALKPLPPFRKWVMETALKEFPPSNKGTFAQAIVEHFGLELPTSEKSGKYSITKKTLEALPESVAKDFLITGDTDLLTPKDILSISVNLWKEKNEGLVNIQSKKQLGEIVFDYMKVKPLSKTEKGSNQFDDDFVEHLAKSESWAHDLYIFNKLVKIKTAYIDRYLENNEDGRYYFYYKQHGTISGRYGSDAQQLPRPLEEGEQDAVILKYRNEVRAFFIPDEGYSFIDCDYESLEPKTFASVSGDQGLIDIFLKGWDFYSTIAIKTEKMENVSPDKKADNFLGKVNKPARQKAKAYCFPEGTEISLRNKDVKDIVDIVIGDEVLTYDFAIRDISWGTVGEVFAHEEDVMTIKTKNNTILNPTLSHPFYVKNKGKWIEAVNLEIGDILMCSDEGLDEVAEIDHTLHECTVYDINVKYDHNFFANGILVHNCLGVPYGMKAYALGQSLGVSTEEAGDLIEGYLGGFPNLRKWMQESEDFAKENGWIKTKVGRVRHLTKVKEIYDTFGDDITDWNFRRDLEAELGKEAVRGLFLDYINGLNNSRNFQIQSLAASIVNRAAIAVNRRFKEVGIDGIVVAQIHDQIIYHVKDDNRLHEAAEIVKDLMENTTKLSLPLTAPPAIAKNWRDGHV